MLLLEFHHHPYRIFPHRSQHINSIRTNINQLCHKRSPPSSKWSGCCASQIYLTSTISTWNTSQLHKFSHRANTIMCWSSRLCGSVMCCRTANTSICRTRATTFTLHVLYTAWKAENWSHTPKNGASSVTARCLSIQTWHISCARNVSTGSTTSVWRRRKYRRTTDSFVWDVARKNDH